MPLTEEEILLHRVSRIRDENELTDFMEKTRDLVDRLVRLGAPAERRRSMARSIETLLRVNRRLRAEAGGIEMAGELSLERDLEDRVQRLRAEDPAGRGPSGSADGRSPAGSPGLRWIGP